MSNLFNSLTKCISKASASSTWSIVSSGPVCEYKYDDNEIAGILHVHVLQGNNLRVPPSVSMDPYVRIQYGSNISTSDAHRNAGANCTIDWKVDFPFRLRKIGDSEDSTDNLIIKVIDENMGRKDGQVGKVIVEYKSLLQAFGKTNSFVGSLKLSYQGPLTLGNCDAGTIDVEYWWEKWSPLSDTPFPLQRLRLVSNQNLTGGLIRMFDGGVFEPFATWQLRLWEVGTIFHGETCGWNQEYAAAQKIYGPTAEAMAIREAIRMQHMMLYSNDAGTGMYAVHMIRGINEFIQALPTTDKNVTPGKSIRFTYVILSNSCMHFSITSKKIAQDFLSKHALHSNASPTVVCAGEFFIDYKSARFAKTGRPALIIDNNSGTFAPPKEKLSKLQTLLEWNFGKDYPIFTLDRSDPALKEYSDVNDIA